MEISRKIKQNTLWTIREKMSNRVKYMWVSYKNVVVVRSSVCFDCMHRLQVAHQHQHVFQSDVVSFQINILSSSFYLLCCTYTQFYDSFFSLCFLAHSNTLKFIAYFRCNGVKWNHLLTLDTLLCGTAFLMITHENWIPSV